MATLKDYLTELKASTEGLGFQCHPDTYQAAIKALEKQIPKKLIGQNTMWGICPNCEKVAEIHAFREPKHCEHCGQALDWSGDK